MGIPDNPGHCVCRPVMGSQAKSLNSLLQQTTIDDHEEILKASNNALKQSKSESETHHVRFIALLKLERYEDALRALEEAGDTLKEKVELERAYALYRSGSLEEAKGIAKAIQSNRGAKHVEAQAVSSPKLMLSFLLTQCDSLTVPKILQKLPTSIKNLATKPLDLETNIVIYG